MGTWQKWQSKSGSGKAPPPGFYPRNASYPSTIDNVPDYFGSVKRNSINFSNIYNILMCQLLITLFSITIGTLHNTTNLYIKSYSNINILVIIIISISFYGLTIREKEQRKTPINLIILFIFILAESFLLAQSVSFHYPEQVFLALKLITFVCFSLTLFALHSKLNFTVLNGFLILTIIVVFIVVVISAFFPGKLISLIIMRDLLISGSNNIFIISYFTHPADSWW